MAYALCRRMTSAVVAFSACAFSLFCNAIVASDEARCEAGTLEGSVGAALLQGHHARSVAVKATLPHDGSTMRVIPFVAKDQKSKANPALVVTRAAYKRGLARDSLPPHLLQLGIEMVGSEDTLDFVIANTREERIQYAGVTVILRMVLGDGSNGTMQEEGGSLYGLDSLPTSGMINMIDLGGNYGVVSIAAYRRFPTQMRAIAVEPIPSTYFLFRWNMYLNGVPELPVEHAADPSSTTTGILAIFNGVSRLNWEVTHFCYSPPYTMQAHVCQCDEIQNGETCAAVVGISLEQLFSYFNGQTITMLKMDCEGCEEAALPALSSAVDSSSCPVQRLVGELHAPTLELEDIACRFDQGRHFVKVCLKDGEYVSRALGCGNPARTMCD